MTEAATGYSWPPFEAGHEHSTKHGAWSDRKVSPIAEQLVAELVTIAPWAAVATFGATEQAWARAEAQVVLIGRYLDEHGPLDDDGVPRPSTVLLERVERRAHEYRKELALTPMAWAQLRRTMTEVAGADADGITAGLRATGQLMLEAKEAAELEAAQPEMRRPNGDDDDADS